MSKKTIKKAEAKKTTETRADRLRRRIGEFQNERAKGLQQLQQLTERLSQIEGAIYALTEELKAEESQ